MKETEIWKGPRQACFLQVKGWEGGEKEWRRKKRRRRKTGRAEMERSNFSDRTNYRNIQEPVSAESISSPSPISSPLFPSLTVSFAPRLSSLFFFSILSYDPSGVTIGEVLPAVSFPSVYECSLLQHPGSREPALNRSRAHWVQSPVSYDVISFFVFSLPN